MMNSPPHSDSLWSPVDSPGVFPLAGSCSLRYPAVMAGTAAERLRLVYALLALLYVGLGLDFYLTARLWRSAVGFGEYREDLQPPLDLKRSKRQYPEDSGIPSVEFFPQPQPTHETDGYVWLTSYSRIPVSLFCFHYFFDRVARGASKRIWSRTFVDIFSFHWQKIFTFIYIIQLIF